MSTDANKIRISWCATSSKDDKESLKKTIDSIKNQSVKPYEILVTYGGNISQGRNKYLNMAKGEVLATFDGGCIYDKDWSKRMLAVMKKENADIVIGAVRPMPPKNRIQKFCISRMPAYSSFKKRDWEKFIPSNRQVIFKREIIERLGLLPEELWRSDDTYWFQKAKKIGLRFAYCPDAIVYWEMKTRLKSYLKTVYNDTKCDFQFGIPSVSASKRTKQQISLYNLAIMVLAAFAKISGIIVGKLKFGKKIEIC